MAHRTSSLDEIEHQSITARIPLAKLFVAGYGRTLNLRRIEKMAKSWDEQAAGSVVLSLRADGTFAILDGAHRVRAAEEVGLTSISSMVLIDLTYEREAELFALLNDKTNPTPMDRFKAKVAARNPEALAITAIAHRHGLEVETNNAVPNRIQAVAGLEAIYEAHGSEMLDQVLGILKDGFGGSPRAYKLEALLGLTAFVVRFQDKAPRSRIVDRLKITGPDAMLQKALVYRQGQSDTLATAWGKAFHGVYNHGLVNRLPDWPGKVLTARGRQAMSEQGKKNAVVLKRSGIDPRETGRQGGLAAQANRRANQQQVRA